MAKPYPQPQIYTCLEWGARPVSEVFPIAPCEKWLLHHTAGNNESPSSSSVTALSYAFMLCRGIQADHMDNNHWSDTGQQYTISHDAIICEGRHGSIAATNKGLHVVAAECQGYNIQSGGTEHEGNFDTFHMPLKMWNASVDLHAWIVDRLKLSSTDIDGHRDHIATDCPGIWFYGQLGNFHKAVHEKLAAWRLANP
jgi:hypothetical protein